MEHGTRLAILPRSGKRPFPPRVSTFTRPFWDALGEGRLITTCCPACNRLSFPPRPLCRGCWSQDVAWRELAGSGTLYSFTRVHVVPRAFISDALYDIDIVDLDEGVRLMCRLVGVPSSFAADGRMDMVVLAYDDGPLFAARPTSHPAGHTARP
jgi:uncharacterized OB-fold protein